MRNTTKRPAVFGRKMKDLGDHELPGHGGRFSRASSPDFSKQLGRETGVSYSKVNVHESRFESVYVNPAVHSKYRVVKAPRFSATLPRNTDFLLHKHNDANYNPNFEYVMRNSSSVIDFNKTTDGRSAIETKSTAPELPYESIRRSEQYLRPASKVPRFDRMLNVHPKVHDSLPSFFNGITGRQGLEFINERNLIENGYATAGFAAYTQSSFSPNTSRLLSFDVKKTVKQERSKSNDPRFSGLGLSRSTDNLSQASFQSRNHLSKISNFA
eukprot:CAMPEP_0114993810 /NCGR_PEP_ID=MMETSP0216-20121206/12755_1 /TAXON_ID=223996 /ORGANISM="Protocruzia adherens, Strain Boccale" /LENGTH=269 /DNA_ID=CAMNT_0002357531 /DNA_START=307 /DNA_END=1116 /DNA_ORIENTATION=-